MRYIRKQKKEPEVMRVWKEAQMSQNLSTHYDIFPDKKTLNEFLRTEQHGICCYCQRRIDHFQEPQNKGSHNEHLYPENRPDDPKSIALQMDYNNIFACCIDSRRMEYSNQYCGEAKRNNIIPELIKDTDCSTYFRYNNLGEIIPDGEYLQWREYVENSCSLTGKIAEAYECIKTLNLNAMSLILFRNEVRERFMTMAKGLTAARLKDFIETYQSAPIYQELLDMKLQLMRQRIKVLEKQVSDSSQA